MIIDKNTIQCIYFAGPIGTGKTTTAHLVGDMLEPIYGVKPQYLSFAEGVRQEASTIFQFPIEWTRSQEGKRKELVEIENYDGAFGPFPKTVREALQQIGEYRRNHEDPQYWVDKLANQLLTVINSGQRLIIIDDVRHGTEALMLRSLASSPARKWGGRIRTYGVKFTHVVDRVAEIRNEYFKDNEIPLTDYPAWDRLGLKSRGRRRWNEQEFKTRSCLSEWALSDRIYDDFFSLVTYTEQGNLSAMASLIVGKIIGVC